MTVVGEVTPILRLSRAEGQSFFHAARFRKSVEELVFELRFEAANAAEPTDLGGPSESVMATPELILSYLHTLRTKARRCHTGRTDQRSMVPVRRIFFCNSMTP